MADYAKKPLNDQYSGTTGSDTISGLAGDDTLAGGGGAATIDGGDVRLLDHLERLAGIGRSALDIAVLPFGIDHVEGSGSTCPGPTAR